MSSTHKLKPESTRLTRVGTAVWEDDPLLLEEALNAGCSVHSREKLVFQHSEQIMSPLSLACRLSKPYQGKILQLLITAGADLDRRMFMLNVDMEEEGGYTEWSGRDTETPLVYTINKQNVHTLEALLNCGVDPLHIFTDKTRQSKDTYLLNNVTHISEMCFLSLFRAGGILPENKNKKSVLGPFLLTLQETLTRFPNALLYLLETDVDWSRSLIFYYMYKKYVSSLSDTEDMKECHVEHLEELELRNSFSTGSKHSFDLVGQKGDTWYSMFPMDDIEEHDITMAQVFNVFLSNFFPFQPFPLKKLCRSRIRNLCGRIKLVAKIERLTHSLSRHMTEYLLFNIDL